MNSELSKPLKKRVTLIGIIEIDYLKKMIDECTQEGYKNIELSMGARENGEYYTIFQANDD